MPLTFNPPPDTNDIREAASEKPLSELRMIVRKASEDREFWKIILAWNELNDRLELKARQDRLGKGLMFFMPTDEKEEDNQVELGPQGLVLRFGK